MENYRLRKHQSWPQAQTGRKKETDAGGKRRPLVHTEEPQGRGNPAPGKPRSRKEFYTKTHF
jgi:hypothetical protein